MTRPSGFFLTTTSRPSVHVAIRIAFALFWATKDKALLSSKFYDDTHATTWDSQTRPLPRSYCSFGCSDRTVHALHPSFAPASKKKKKKKDSSREKASDPDA